MLVPWVLALDRTASWRATLVSAVAMAFAFSVAVFSWFPPAMADYASAPVWAMALLGAVATPFFQPQFVTFALARYAARRRGLAPTPRALVGAGAYVATEWLVPKLFGDTLAIGLFPSRLLRQAADLGGLGGLTFVIVLVNEWLAMGVTAVLARRSASHVLRAFGAAAMAIMLVAGYGAARLATLDAADGEPSLTVGIVQADVGHYERLAQEIGTYEAVGRILDAHFAVSEEALARGPLDVLVWPETVYPTTFGAPKSSEGAAFDRVIGGFATHAGVPLIFGSYDAAGGREYNAAVFLEPGRAGEVTFDVYRKATLFPFTERVPSWLDGPRLRAWLPWLGSWEPGVGAAVTTLTLRGGRKLRIAPLICYDALEPRLAERGVRQGAEVIVTLSNDSWLANGAGARLHAVVAAFRSIETRRPQVRATTTGISAVITPAGDVVAEAGIHERTALVATVVPRHGSSSLVVRLGEWPGATAMLLVLALLARGRTGVARTRRPV